MSPPPLIREGRFDIYSLHRRRPADKQRRADGQLAWPWPKTAEGEREGALTWLADCLPAMNMAFDFNIQSHLPLLGAP